MEMKDTIVNLLEIREVLHNSGKSICAIAIGKETEKKACHGRIITDQERLSQK